MEEISKRKAMCIKIDNQYKKYQSLYYTNRNTNYLLVLKLNFALRN